MVSLADVIWDMASNMWTFAELGSHEEKSSAYESKVLEEHGLRRPADLDAVSAEEVRSGRIHMLRLAIFLVALCVTVPALARNITSEVQYHKNIEVW